MPMSQLNKKIAQFFQLMVEWHFDKSELHFTQYWHIGKLIN
jgi:NADPH-dependent ferric siderophore reductase